MKSTYKKAVAYCWGHKGMVDSKVFILERKTYCVDCYSKVFSKFRKDLWLDEK